MKNKLFKILLLFVIIFGNIKFVDASSVSVKASSSSVTKGSSVTITATVSADSGIYTIEGSVSCSGAGASGGVDLKYEDLNVSNKFKSYTFTIKPTSSGTVTCSSSNVRLRELARESEYQLGNSSVSINVKEPAVVKPREYSSNNNLSSLSVEGYDISPSFNNDVLEYSLILDESIEKIKVNASASDNKASVTGNGEVNLTSGENNILVKVVAENGNEKVYKIVVNVVDQHPITVTIDDASFTIVKKNNDVLDIPQYYQEKVIKINDQDVISYINEESNITLVILKDKDNLFNYYIYDEVKNTYSLYNEFRIGDKVLYILPMDSKKLPDGYKKYNFTYNEREFIGYKLSHDSNFYLLNAMNISNGNKCLYLYDAKEGTVQRYDSDILKYFTSSLDNGIKNYKNSFYISLGVIGVLSVCLIIFLIVNLAKKKRNLL